MKNFIIFLVFVNLYAIFEPSEEQVFEYEENLTAKQKTQPSKKPRRKHLKKPISNVVEMEPSLPRQEVNLLDFYDCFNKKGNQDDEELNSSDLEISLENITTEIDNPCPKSESPLPKIYLREDEDSAFEINLNDSIVLIKTPTQDALEKPCLQVQEEPSCLESNSSNPNSTSPKLSINNVAKKTNNPSLTNPKSNRTLENSLPKNNVQVLAKNNKKKNDKDLIDEIEETGCCILEMLQALP